MVFYPPGYPETLVEQRAATPILDPRNVADAPKCDNCPVSSTMECTACPLSHRCPVDHWALIPIARDSDGRIVKTWCSMCDAVEQQGGK